MATLIQSLQFLLAQKDAGLANETKRILLKEYLQTYTLDFLYNHPLYQKLNFYGGTCLQFVYGLNRLSEDLALDDSAGIDFHPLEEDLLKYFQVNVGYPAVTVKSQVGEWGIQRITLKFPILYELRLSSHVDEALHFKVEISQHRQISVLRRTPVLAHGRSFVLKHFSLETMMAGKMLACLERNFQVENRGIEIKGRDFYDLLWFMHQKTRPLEEKLAKEGTKPYTVKSAFEELTEKVGRIRRSDLAADLLPLFEQRSFIEAWLDGFQENFALLAADYIKE